jgi:hypothetical protein
MFGVAIRAEDLALRHLGEDALPSVSEPDRFGDRDLLLARVSVMKDDARWMILSAARTHELALELLEPRDNRSSSTFA